jgi:hypothetical protein
MFWYHPSAQDDKRELAFGRNNKSPILFLFFLKKKIKEKCEESRNMTRSKGY